MIFDIHTHCFPDRIAKSAIEKLAHASGGLAPFFDGTFDGLRDFMKKEGVDGFCVQNIATNPKQMHNVNDFAASCQRENVFPFGCVHPDAPDALEELFRIKEMGLRGIKLHPDYQGFFVDDKKMIPIYKKASELGLIILFHAGEDYGFAPPYHCMPENLERALLHIDTPVIAAHYGGQGVGDEVLSRLCGKEVYFDVSFGYSTRPKAQAQAIIEKHGSEKILFGSDCPWHSPEMELRLLLSLGLSQNEMDDICYNNAKKLLGF